jgi:hypothetical protein
MRLYNYRQLFDDNRNKREKKKELDFCMYIQRIDRKQKKEEKQNLRSMSMNSSSSLT